MNMKKTTLAFLGLIALSTSAQAQDVQQNEVIFSNIVKVSDTSCAVKLRLEENNGSGFPSSNQVIHNGTVIADFSGFAATNLEKGASILFATPTFETENNIAADGALDESVCPQINSSSNFEYFSGGTLINRLDASRVSGFGGNMTAINRESGAVEPSFVDLVIDFLGVKNNAGDVAAVGDGASGGEFPADVDNEEDDDDDGDGCSLNPAAGASLPMMGLMLSFMVMNGLAFIGLRRKS